MILEFCLNQKNFQNSESPLYLIQKIFVTLNKQQMSFETLQNICSKVLETILDNGELIEDNLILLQTIFYHQIRQDVNIESYYHDIKSMIGLGFLSKESLEQLFLTLQKTFHSNSVFLEDTLKLKKLIDY